MTAASSDSVAAQPYLETPLEATLSALPSLYLVDLHGQGLGPSAAERLAAAFEGIRSGGNQLRLVSLQLSDNRLGALGARRVVEAALACRDARGGGGNAGEHRTSGTSGSDGGVRLVDLSWNHLGPDGACAVSTALQGAIRPLQALDLECNGIGDEGAVSLARALPRTTGLQMLRLGGNSICARGGEALAEALPLTNVESLELGRNHMGPRGVAAFARAVRHSGSLQRLGLSVNRAGDDGACAFAAVLRQDGTIDNNGALRMPSSGSNLDVLDLGGNRISDQGSAALARSLSEGSCHLRCLGLSYNRLTDSSIDVFTEAVEAGRNQWLQSVELVGNEAATPAALNRVTVALRRNSRSIMLYDPLNAALELCTSGAYRVDLTGVHVGDVGAQRFAAALGGSKVRVRELLIGNAGLGDRAIATLAPALARRIGKLEELDLSWNLISRAGAADLGAALLRHPSVDGSGIVVLDLECNRLGDAGVAALFSPLLAVPIDVHRDRQLDEVSAAHGGAELETGAALGNASAATPKFALRVLRLAGNGISAAGALNVADALTRPYVQIQELDMSRNSLGPKGAAVLASVFKAPACPLRSLNLSVNKLKDAGAELLAAALTQMRANRTGADGAGLDAATQPSITLELCSNLIGDVGAEALSSALAVSPAVMAVALDFNKVGSRGAEALAVAVRTRCTTQKHAGARAPSMSFSGNPMEGSASELSLNSALDEAQRQNATDTDDRSLGAAVPGAVEGKRRLVCVG